MAVYQYRCAGCGPFEVARPRGAAGRSRRRGGCGGTAPTLTRTPRPPARALTAQAAGAYEPRVTDRVPPAARRPAFPAGPRHAVLPDP
jgi:hypothetical protein